jgi:hypothetical protein
MARLPSAVVRDEDFLFADRQAYDLVVTNPPFLGWGKISTQLGAEYVAKLRDRYPAKGLCDLAGYFVRASIEVMGHESVGAWLTTKSIFEGKSQRNSIDLLEADGWLCEILEGRVRWPGEAQVLFSTFLIQRGDAKVRELPAKLRSNANCSFRGGNVRGMGFTLTPAELEEILQRNPRNAERIFPYLGGEEVNTSPTQDFDRYVINFGAMTEAQARGWPDLMEKDAQVSTPQSPRCGGVW